MTVSCLGDEVDIELEDDGTLLLSSLQANFTNGSGLIYYTDEGRKQSECQKPNCFLQEANGVNKHIQLLLKLTLQLYQPAAKQVASMWSIVLLTVQVILI